MNLPLLDQFKNKSILIWGAGREGISTYTFLSKHVPESNYIICDAKVIDALSEEAKKIISKNKNLTYLEQTLDFFRENTFDFIFKSPGISPFQGLAQQALNQTGTFWSNTSLFFDLVADNSAVTTIGVTGTKGKSTTSMAISTLLKAANKETFLIGNIGQPALDLVDAILAKAEKNPVYPVLELSSHQLLHLEKSPQIAVVQELSPEHLDYYPNIESYYKAKTAITQYQKPDDLVLYYSSSTEAEKIAGLSPATTKIGFSLEKNEDLIPDVEIALKGKHNRINILPAILIAKYLKIGPEVIEAGLKNIKPLPHRLELVAETNQITFYDDSLATTPEATIEALRAFKDENIILLAGGYERQQKYQALATTIIKSKTKMVIAFPTTGKRLINEITAQAKQLKQKPPKTVLVKNMTEAAKEVHIHAKSGDIVLLSPAAASFNLFKDYADRGDQFKKLVSAKSLN